MQFLKKKKNRERHMNDQQLELTMIITSNKYLCLLRHVLNIMSNYAACTKENLPYRHVLQQRPTTPCGNTPSTVRPIVAR